MKKILIGLTAAVMAVAPAQAVTLYGVDEVNNLVRFDSRTPGVTQSSVAIQGLGGSSLLGIDFRVRDGFLYGLTDNNRVFRINYNTGATSLVSSVALTGSNFAFDFNPTNTNLRIVSNDNSNYVLRFNPAPITLVPGINVAYAAGTTGVIDPDIVSAGYTNNDNLAGTGTTLFVLDSANDILATQNAATGVLTRVGALGINIGARTSFDISGSANNTFVQAGNTLYNINLSTGALSAIGTTDRVLFGLSAAVPEPATWAMMVIGFGAVGAAARSSRRKRNTVTA
jgi:Domain of unknown function (DUF4394)/PEP-CTERM motif